MATAEVVRDLARLGVAVDGVEPLAVLHVALATAAGDLNAMRTIVAGVSPRDPHEPRTALYQQVLDRAARLAEMASRTNLAERIAAREMAVTSHQVEVISKAVDAAITPLGLPDGVRHAAMQRLAVALRDGAP